MNEAKCGKNTEKNRKKKQETKPNLFVRDMDLGVPNAHDNLRLEVVAVQFAVDTTLVSAIQGCGQPQRRAADRDGVALKRARRMKETTYPEFVQWGSPGSSGSPGGGPMVAGSQDVRAVARRGPHQVGAASDAAAHGTGVASSLVLDPGHGVDGHTLPDHEVERDHHHAGLCG